MLPHCQTSGRKSLNEIKKVSLAALGLHLGMGRAELATRKPLKFARNRERPHLFSFTD